MRIEQNINGYKVIGVNGKDFSNMRAGLSIWTFAKKNEIEYFMKEFLAPKYPDIDSPGSEELRIKKKLSCEKFEKYHQLLKNTIDKDFPNDAYLVRTLDFFRFGTKYYKISLKIDGPILSIEDVAAKSFPQRLLILKTMSLGLQLLHSRGLVHGDVKHDNILFRNAVDNITSYLIDYDNCYFAKDPPQKEKMVGDVAYFSPEVENYVLNRNGLLVALTAKSDIFSLGLIFCQYLTGKMPSGVAVGRYASNIVNNGSVIKISSNEGLPISLVNLVNSMLLINPNERPDINTVLAVLKSMPDRSVMKVGNVVMNLGGKKIKN